MNLIINQMMQFQVVHVSDGNRAVEILAGTSIAQTNLAVSGYRNALPQFSVLSIVRQILKHFRKQFFLMFCLKLFPA